MKTETICLRRQRSKFYPYALCTEDGRKICDLASWRSGKKEYLYRFKEKDKAGATRYMKQLHLYVDQPVAKVKRNLPDAPEPTREYKGMPLREHTQDEMRMV